MWFYLVDINNKSKFMVWDIIFPMFFFHCSGGRWIKKQRLNTKCQPILLVLFQFKKKRGQSGLFSSWNEKCCWHLMFSIWFLVTGRSNEKNIGKSFLYFSICTENGIHYVVLDYNIEYEKTAFTMHRAREKSSFPIFFSTF